MFKFFLKGSKKRKPLILNQETLKQYLHYNPRTGIFTWLANAGKRLKIGCTAGSQHSAGYIQISFLGKMYKAHRLAWLYMKGEWPKYQIDHKDGKRSNNIWNNIRAATGKQNAFNKKIYKNNKSGVKGVAWNKSTPKKPWMAQICVKGEKLYLGCFSTIEEASDVYQIAAEKCFGRFKRKL